MTSINGLTAQAPSLLDKAAVWSASKPKYFFETIANVCFYASKAFPQIKEFGRTSQSISGFKGFFGVPGAIKGARDIVHDIYTGKKKPVRDYVGSVCFVVSDSIDGVKAAVWSGIASVSKSTLQLLGRIKNVVAIVGLSNSVYNDTNKLIKLGKIDPNQIEKKSVKDVDLSKKIKAKWLSAEKNKVWWTREKSIMGIALCTLGLAAAGIAVTPWVFAGFATASIAGKMLSHFNQQEAEFWDRKLVEQVVV